MSDQIYPQTVNIVDMSESNNLAILEKGPDR